MSSHVSILEQLERQQKELQSRIVESDDQIHNVQDEI